MGGGIYMYTHQSVECMRVHELSNQEMRGNVPSDGLGPESVGQV